jgi:bacteriorhodopsin
MMATGVGRSLLDGNRLFYWFRYIEWLITTPLLLLVLALLALGSVQRNVRLVATLLGLDVFMVLTGLLAGSRESGFGRGFWFLVSLAALIGLLYLVWTRLFASAVNQPQWVQAVLRTLVLLTIVVWSLYPVVWLLSTTGFGAFGSTIEVLLFLILDFIAGIGFGFLLLTNRQALADVGAAQVRPSRVR